MRKFHSEEIKKEELIDQAIQSAEELERSGSNVKKGTKALNDLIEIDNDRELVQEARELTTEHLRKKYHVQTSPLEDFIKVESEIATKRHLERLEEKKKKQERVQELKAEFRSLMQEFLKNKDREEELATDLLADAQRIQDQIRELDPKAQDLNAQAFLERQIQEALDKADDESLIDHYGKTF